MAQTPSTPLREAGDENVRRTETYIGGLIQTRANELGLNLGDGTLREVTTQISGRLTPAQINGSASINVGDVSGAIDAELRKQTDAGKPVNQYSAEAARRSSETKPLSEGALALLGTNRMTGGRGNDGNGESRASGARFDGMGSSTDWNSPAGQAYMRNYAMEKGVSWAANNSEILRLGPAGIDVLARTKLHEETFNRLTKEVGLSVKGSVGIAAIAEKKGVEANGFANQVADTVNTVTAGNPAARKEVTSAIDDYASLQLNPKATEAQKAAALQRVKDTTAKAAGDDPAKKAEAEKLPKLLDAKNKEVGAAVKVDTSATANAAARVETAKANVETKNDAANEFDAAEPAKTPDKPGPTGTPKPVEDKVAKPKAHEDAKPGKKGTPSPQSRGPGH